MNTAVCGVTKISDTNIFHHAAGTDIKPVTCHSGHNLVDTVKDLVKTFISDMKAELIKTVN